MRILKTKIARSAQSKEIKVEEQPVPPIQEYQKPVLVESSQKITPNRTNPQRRGRKQEGDDGKGPSTKTIVKNYGKAIASFAASTIAVPYLAPLLKEEGVELDQFTRYITLAKETIEGIDTFRALLLPKNTDNEEIAAYKRIFRAIAEVFINYFSVNWIFNGRMADKKTHLKFRFKILRRIKNPELFTYLK